MSDSQTPVRQIPRELLSGSYQHLLLALGAGLLLSTTETPAAAAIVVCATQFWRMRLMRLASSMTREPSLKALAYARGYFFRAQTVLLLLAGALVLGLGLGLAQEWGSEQAVASMQGMLFLALLSCVAVVAPGYLQLQREPERW